MKIELTKTIQLKSITVIAEVNFFNEQSPYIDLLKEISHQNDLEEKLKEQGLSEAAIKNVIRRLENLRVIQNSSIFQSEKGFPEKEYGKYKIYYCENDRQKPFQYKNYSIDRVSTFTNQMENIENIPDFLLKSLREESFVLQEQQGSKKESKISKDSKFQILFIEEKKGLIDNHLLNKNTTLRMTYETEQWNYQIFNESFKMDSIPMNDIFKGKWNEEEQALNIGFDEISDEEKKSFKKSHDDELELNDYGKFNAQFYDVPLIPDNEPSAKKWFLYLLKNRVEEENQYLTYHNAESVWNDIFAEYHQISHQFYFDFSFEEMLQSFKANTQHYWYLMAGKDLNPFDDENKMSPSVTIEEQENRDLSQLFEEKFHISNVEKLIIIDSYIYQLNTFKILESLLKAYPEIKITIFTGDRYKSKKKDVTEIGKICRKLNISYKEKKYKNMPHDRYWVFDNIIYRCSNSLGGFIKIEKDGQFTTKNTQFFKNNESQIEKQAQEFLKESNESN